MKALTRTILFARAAHGKQVHQWPVAVFPNAAVAKQYAFMIRTAYKAGDHDTVHALDPAVRAADDGTLLPDMRWSVADVPYAPELPDMDDETEVA